MKTHKKIFIIDDEEILRFIAKTIAKKIDNCINITTFNNGYEAISSLKQMLFVSKDELPDIILIDINMPVMDGWQFLDEFIKIKSQFLKEIAIYILSSSTSDEDIYKTKGYAEVTGYLIKPIETNALRKIIQFEFSEAS